MADVRSSGQTTEMLKQLGEGKSVVVVHNSNMRDHVLNIVRRLNDEDKGARNVKAVIISLASDTEILRGLSCPIVVDHAFWQFARADVAAAVRQFERAK